MLENKNKFETDEKSLREADFNKSDEAEIGLGKKSGYDFLQKEKRMKERDRGAVTIERAAKKKMPLALDIIISVIAVALVVFVVLGSVFALKYFSTEYDARSVRYTVLMTCEIGDSVGIDCKKGADVYSDIEGKTLFLGSVVSLKPAALDESEELEDGMMLYALTIETDTKYRDGEGYFADGYRLAVGKTLDLRIGARTETVYIAEISEAGK